MQQQVIEGFRLSPQQQRLWRLRNGGATGTAQCVLAVAGELSAGTLAQALSAVVARHEILRTRFERLPGMEMPIQAISSEPLLTFREVALDGDPEGLAGFLEEERALLEIDRGRFSLVLTPQNLLLVITLPALLADSRSLDNLAAEIARSYGAAIHSGEDLTEPSLQYVQFSEWQNEVLEDAAGRDASEFWHRQRLGEDIRRLPLENPRTHETRWSYPISLVRIPCALPADLACQVERVAREHGASLEALLLACWAGLLARLSGSPDVAVDVLFDGRKVEELADALGPLGRFLPLGLRRLGGHSFSRVLRRMESTLAKTGERQEVCPERTEDRPALLGFAFEEPPAGPWTAGEIIFSMVDKLYTSGDCELVLWGRRRGDALDLELLGDPQIYTGEGLRLLASRFLALLESAVHEPETSLDELEWIGPEERGLLEAWSLRPLTPVPEPVLARAFTAQAEQTPGALAVAAGGQALTFRDLRHRCGDLSRRLRRLGVGPESRVALYLDRSVDAIAALFAVLEAGGAYVPIDAGQTGRRLAWILDDAGADVVVTCSSLAGALPFGADVRRVLVDALPEADEACDASAAPAGPSSCAYVIYTSGSTGHPKGALIENRSAACLSAALAAAVYAGFEDGSPLRVAVNAPLSFDASVKQVIQLLRGHSLWLVPEEVRGDGEAFLAWLRENRIDVMDCTPSHLRLLLDAGLADEAPPFPRVLLVGGEAIRPDLWREIAADRSRRYYNVYGPTECTVDAVACRVDSASGPTLGRSLPGVAVHVLDERLRRVPIGVPGELCLAGAQLARGYHGRPDLTAERFVPAPFAAEPGARLYRTGDRVRFLPDGRLEFLGRLDRQLKVRGVRVEPGEIEAALRESSLVRDALVVLREDQPGNQRLVAYAVPRRRAGAAAVSAGRPRYELPNGMAVVHQNRNETDYLYEEIFEKRCYLKHGVRLPADACVLDVGANIGMFTLLVHQECARPRVYAFEPIPAIFEALRANCELYGPETKLFSFGLSAAEREESFTFYPRYTMMSGLSRHARPESEAEVVKRYLENLRREGSGDAEALLEDADELLAGRFQGEVVTARLRRLSDVLREERIARVDLLKVDVQRAEIEVLQGLDEEDWERIDQIVLEVHDAPGTDSEGRVGGVLSLLERHGFRAVAEQDELLAGTDRYNIYAVSRRLDGAAEAEPRRALLTPAATADPDLRQFLKSRLPEALVPAAVVWLDEIPLTRNGKVDFSALPPPEARAPAREAAPPRTLHEEILTSLWAEVLGLEQVGVDESFFELGGHSLLATQLMSRIRAAFSVDLPLRALFEKPTVAELAIRIEEAVRAGQGLEIPPIVMVPRKDGPSRLSFAQQRLWFLYLLDPQSPAYNTPQAFAVSGALELPAFAGALTEVARRHEVLRTVFEPVGGEPRQVVQPAAPVPVRVVELADLPEELRRAEVRRLAGEDARSPFDLQRGPLLRCAVLRQGAEDHVVLLGMHHVVCDAWSIGILIRELSVLYAALRRGATSPLAELPFQYGDFAEWQRSWLRGEVLEAHLRFWRGQLAGAESRATLPADRPRTAQVGRRGAQQRFFLPVDTSETLQQVARSRGVTLFMLLLAAVQTLLRRYGGGEELVVVGTPIAGRNRLEIEPLIGFFVNTLVLVSRLGDDPGFCELLARTRQETLSAFAHQDLPFEKLVEEIAPHRDLDRTPLFDVLFALQNVTRPAVEVPGLRISPLREGSGAAKFDLSLILSEGDSGLAGGVEYDPSLFDAATVERLLARFAALLAAVAAEPGRRLPELPFLLPVEQAQVLGTWNATRREYPREACLPELFEQVARELGEAPAIVTAGGEIWSYRRLDEESNHLARRLGALGVIPESAVGLCMERSPELILGMLAILKAGGVYVPLDASYPDERLAFMVADTGARLVVVQEGTRERMAALPGVTALGVDLDSAAGAACSAEPLSLRVPAAGLAYVIYTSGSTGKPKGVAVSHRAIVRLVRGTDYLQLGSRDRVAHLSNTSFDAATFEVWGAMLNGAAVVVVPREVALVPADFAALLRREGVTALFLTTALFNQVVREAPGAFSGVRHVLFGGEAVDPAAVAQALEQAGPERLLHVYGPTECTTFATWHLLRAVPSGATTLPIGLPLANTSLYVLDAGGRPVPPGVAGELFLGGDGLARGYWNRPELTAERFVPDPWGMGERLYRTGDRGRHLADGPIEILGRFDHQVKIRGFRVELGEIEELLRRSPGVRDGVVVVREDTPGDKRLVAYAVPEPGSLHSTRDVREILGRTLPEYMVPSSIVLLDALPVTLNGKVDRRALPVPQEPGVEGEEDFSAPRGPLEDLLAGIWAEVLGRERVGVHDDFFELGGHSLLATRLMSRVRERLRAELPLRALFESPTVAGLAEHVERTLRQGEGVGSAPPMIAVPRDRPLRLSFAQQRLWFLHQLDPLSPAYNMPQAFAVSGAMDKPAFIRALAEVVRRHEVLRTIFVPVDGEPRQVVLAAEPVAVPLVDLTALAEEPRQAEVCRLAREDAAAPFDLEQGPLLRCAILQRSAQDHVVLLSMHHVVSDGWSMGILIRELSALYEAFRQGEGSPLAELLLQYGDFAEWQRSWLEGEMLEGQLRFWRSRLEGTESRASLPLDRPRTARVGRRGELWPFLLDGETSQGLQEMARAHGVTLFMLLLAAVQTLLWRYGGGDEAAVVGTPIAGRNRLETEPLIGFFVNTLVLSSSLTDDSGFCELLERTREEMLSAFAHQDVPFEKLVEEIAPHRDATRTPLFDVLFALQNVETPYVELPALRIAPLRAEGETAKFDLSLILSEVERGIGGGFSYDPSLFDAATVERLSIHFAALLRAVAAEPGRRLAELPLLAEAELAQLLEWGAARLEHAPGDTLAALFEERVRQDPSARAVTCEGSELTYGELNARVNRLAHHLRRLGVRPEVRVGLCAERSLDLVVGMLGIVKAGGAYLPLDPSYPRERLAFLIEDAGARVLIGTERALANLPQGDVAVRLEEVETDPESDLPPLAEADHTAYVIYTSGSTGRPKGVQVTHGNVVRLLAATQPWFGFGPDDVWTLFHSSAFDFSVWEIWGALLTGGRLVVVPWEVSRTPQAFHDLLAAERVTVLNQTPTAFAELMQVDEEPAREDALPDLRLVIFGGEALAPARLAGWFARHGETQPRLVNMYGITETTVHVTYRPLSAQDARTGQGSIIGVPIPDLAVRVLDSSGQLAPLGVPGELAVGGAGVARGYLGRPDLTAERFVPDPFCGPGARLYRSGDLGRLLAGGELEYLGRIDQQVKIRGFRIEPGEIEAALLAHPDVRQAVVLARTDELGTRLIAFVVPGPKRRPESSELRSLLAGTLPEHQVPAVFVLLDVLPLTANGKVDRRALLASELASSSEERSSLPPRNLLELELVRIWEDLLGVHPVGVTDDFFELGGHSLLATRLMSRVRERLRAALPLRALFESPTVAGLAEHVERTLRQGEGAGSAPPMIAVPRDRPLRLSFAQQRLWFLHQLDPLSPAYNMPQAFAVSGALEVAAFADALSEVVRRHEVLRTVFTTVEGEPRQVVQPSEPVPVPVVDLTSLAPRGEEARRLARDAARAPFDLERGPLLRCTVLRRGAGDHMVLLGMHHVASDGWSMDLLMRELSVLYEAARRGEASSLAELPLQYGDFAEWQRSWLQGEALEPQLRFWRPRLEGAVSRASLPLDRPRTAQMGRRGEQRAFLLDGETSQALQELARAQGVTLFMLLLAAVQALLWRYGGGDELAVVGTPIAGRNRIEIEPLIGFFVNTLVLGARLGDDPSFSGLLERTREETLSAFAHQDLPFEKLVEEIAPHREIDRTPLFDVMFALQNLESVSVELPELRIVPLPGVGGTAKFDLLLTLSAAERGIGGGFEYDASLFDGATVARLGGHLTALLGAAVAEPGRRLSELPLLSECERHALLAEGNDTAPVGEDCPVHERFTARAAADPERLAVIDGARSLSYGELDRRSNRLARALRRLGVGPEVVVGIALERSLELIVSLLGVLKAGGAYLPLDPGYPMERLAFMLEDSGAMVVLTQEALGGTLPAFLGFPIALDSAWEAIAAEDDGPVAVRVDPEDLAYVIYTSGSTGAPKGAMVSHGALATCARVTGEFQRIIPGERVLQFYSIAFDASVEEIYPCLTHGAALVLRSASMLDSPAGFLAECGRLGLAVVSVATAYWHELAAAVEAEELEVPASLRLMIIGGEEARAHRLRAWRRTGVRMINAYGPTETTVDVTRSGLGAWSEEQSRVPIGRVREGTRAYLLDARLRPVPLGVTGEICVGGGAVARGYLGRPERTAESFVPDPFAVHAGGRMYHTGDLGRFRPDGELEFLGRIDQQVKVRGFRIEPGEIEAALLAYPGVRQAAVVAREDARGDRRLVAYVAAAEAPVSPQELKDFLRRGLPDYMIPGAIVVLASLPRTVTGKIDRRALPAPELASGSQQPPGLPPRSLLELELVRIWEDVLGVHPVGVTEDFFELGGHSLLAVRLAARIQEQTGQRLSLVQLLRGPTVERLAAALRHSQPAVHSSLVAIQPAGSQVPLFWVHPAGGHVMCYLELSRCLGQDQPFYAFRAQGLEPGETCLPDAVSMAAEYCAELTRFQPRGPYLLGGWSMGGLVAYEMARRLLAEGQEVGSVVLLDTHAPGRGEAATLSDEELLAAFAADLGLGRETLAPVFDRVLHKSREGDGIGEILEAAKGAGIVPPDLALGDLRRLFEVFRANARAMEEYPVQPYPGRLTVIAAEEGRRPHDDRSLGWESLSVGGLEVCETPGDHYSVLREPQVKSLAERLSGLAVLRWP